MAHYVISDIHGEMDRFMAMLEKIHFSDEDTLFILGDVVDRGPDGVEILRYIMDKPNIQMLMGNHEHMCLRFFSEDATDIDVRRWSRNGNATTLQGFRKLREKEILEVLYFVQDLPVHMEITVNGTDYYLVHGFPGATFHDEVWGRPEADTPNPVPGKQVIVGHTPVLNFIADPEERERYARALIRSDDHLRIFHSPGFICIDCGCGHRISFRALACLRLEDMQEFYT